MSNGELVVTDEEALDALRRAFVEKGWKSVQIDGHDLRRKPFIRRATEIAVNKGWLDLGELIEGDQWSWYNAVLTHVGKQALGIEPTECPFRFDKGSDSMRRYSTGDGRVTPSIYDQLRQALREDGRPFEVIAKISGFSVQTIVKLERGEGSVNFTTAVAIAKVLRLELRYVDEPGGYPL